MAVFNDKRLCEEPFATWQSVSCRLEYLVGIVQYLVQSASGVTGAFVECVAFEIPRRIRINLINPTFLEEAWDIYGEMMPSFQTVTFTIMVLAI